jgi:hypothetical protein
MFLLELHVGIRYRLKAEVGMAVVGLCVIDRRSKSREGKFCGLIDDRLHRESSLARIHTSPPRSLSINAPGPNHQHSQTDDQAYTSALTRQGITYLEFSGLSSRMQGEGQRGVPGRVRHILIRIECGK